MRNSNRRPTIETVAERAGVSRQTVSNAFNAPHRLHPDTLKRVLGTIDELGYRPSHAARSLRTRATGVIGCRLLPGDYGGTGGVLDRLLHALCDAARGSGYNVLAFSVATDDEEIGVFDDLLRRNAVDGFVLANTHHGDVRPDWLVDQGARFVAFGRPWGVQHARHSWVDVDGASGTAEAVNHLAGLGHTRVAFLGLGKGNGVGDNRYHGWETAMADLGLPVSGLVARAEDGIASGKALADQLLDAAAPPTAFVCVSDAMAVGALRAIEDRGMVAGSDVSVVGFDDSPIASVITPRLSSVRQPIEGVAHKLVEILLAELGGTQRRPSRVLLAPWLVRRDSTSERPTSRPPLVKQSAGKERTVKEPAVKEPAVKEPAVKEPAVKGRRRRPGQSRST
jgi:DNA-binding LacI/PurR family transcriptional regulator